MSKGKQKEDGVELNSSASRRKHGGMGVMIVLLLIALAPGGYFYMQYKDTQKKLTEQSSASTQSEIQKLVDEVSAVIELPSENPTVATVSDVEKLKEQPFFAKAEVGDKVLIFTEAKKAILYRPATKKVIEVGPVSIKPQDTSGSNSNINSATTTNSNTNTNGAAENTNSK